MLVANSLAACGTERTYRSGGQVNVDAQPANVIEALLTACSGRLSEIGGFYKIHLGAPDSPAFAWTDADLLSSEEQTYRPFFGLADSVNGIQVAPIPIRARAGKPPPRRRCTAPTYWCGMATASTRWRHPRSISCHILEQVQRLQEKWHRGKASARAPMCCRCRRLIGFCEPGDTGTWNSTRNGYVDKLFRVDSVIDRANFDCVFNVTEIDPADYDWDHTTDYTGVATEADGVSAVMPSAAGRGRLVCRRHRAL